MTVIGGHRGSGCTDSVHAAPYCRHKPPENTLPAIQKAILDGAGCIEIDVVQTKDNKIAVIHSNDLNRHVQSPKNLGFVGDYTLSDLKKLPVGMHQNGVIPELCEVLAVCRNVVLIIEIKDVKGTSDSKFKANRPSLLELLANALTSHQGEVILSSFSEWDMAKAAELMPDVKRGLLFIPDTQPQRAIYNHGDEPSHYLHFTPQNVRRAAAGVPLSCAHPCVGSVSEDAMTVCKELDFGVNVWSLKEMPPQQNPAPLSKCANLCQKFNRPLTIITDFVPEMRQFLENSYKE